MGATTRIGCLHAHHGNIGYIDALLAPYRAEAAHFVDPALVRRIGVDPGFSPVRAAHRVVDQLNWIAESGVAGILVTCTAYAAAMPPPDMIGLHIPIVTIDEPFFAAVCAATAPQRIAFSNPGTVEGTMRRLTDYAKRCASPISATSTVIPGVFDLFMAGRADEHDRTLTERLTELALANPGGSLFAGQLSMSTAARHAAALSGVPILSPLDCLESEVVERLGLVRRNG